MLIFGQWYSTPLSHKYISKENHKWLNSSQLAKMKKEYSWHVPAMKFIGMKQLV